MATKVVVQHHGSDRRGACIRPRRSVIAARAARFRAVDRDRHVCHLVGLVAGDGGDLVTAAGLHTRANLGQLQSYWGVASVYLQTGTHTLNY